MVAEEARSNKRQKEECTIDCLPGDIIEKVFLKLPVSTLVRCAGVCKQWRNFIQDPQFVTSQLERAPRYTLLFSPQESVSHQPYPSDAVLIDEVGSHSACAVPVIGPDDLLFGSCNGLLGLYTKTSTIKIANFATGECLHLQKPVQNLRGDHFSLYTFGFHPTAKQYKITHLLPDCTETGRMHYNDKVSVIQVYTLGDEKWKDIRTSEALSLKCVRDSGLVNSDGTLYWLSEDMMASCQHAVMSFDLSEESFARIQLSAAMLEDCADAGPRRYWVREVDCKICIATAQTYRYMHRWLSGKLKIWTLDNKREHRWSHKHSIQHPSDCILSPNLFHGHKIIKKNHDGNLCLYELFDENYNINFWKALDFSPRKHNLQSYNCVKSLVRLDVFKKAGIVRRPKQREGWELKKWQVWEQKLSKMETMWCQVHQVEHQETVFAQSMHVQLNRLLSQKISDAVMRQHIGMEISQIFPAFPSQQARPLQRLNWVESKQDMEKLFDRLENVMHVTMAMTRVIASIDYMIRNATQGQAFAQSMRIKLNRLLKKKISDYVMRQRIGMEINQTFPAFPSQSEDILMLKCTLINDVIYVLYERLQQARPLRRLIWTEYKLNKEKIFDHLEKFMHATMAMTQVLASVGDMIISATQDQRETPVSEAGGIASDSHSDDIDTDLRLGSLSRHSP